MQARADGSAGDADYGTIGPVYTRYRQPEPAIAAYIDTALGSARTVLNVGAGAGSYEPLDRHVTPVEPSAAMRAQRPSHLAAVVDAVAEQLPFPDGHFDAAMTTFSVHQWSGVHAGLKEMRRVTRGPVLVLTCDPTLVQRFWLNDYAPGVLATEARRYPGLEQISGFVGRTTDILSVAIPFDCRDGFNEAYYGRPERFLNSGARLACSAWSFVSEAVCAAYVEALSVDLACGEWDRRYGRFRNQPCFDGSLRLIVGFP